MDPPNSINSDSDLDPQQYTKLYAKLERKAKRRQQQISIDVEQPNYTPKNKSRHSHQQTLYHTRQRSRSRDKTPQHISWHIYDDIGKIDYIDTLPEKLQQLPIFKKKDQIIQKIIQNQIVLITGDTGCGKSTQVPRLIYQYLKKSGKSDKIICVQPRRLAVTSLKSSVQSQLPDRQRVVGYQIGQKAQFNTFSRIVFMTNGIFLQRITHDTDFLNEYPFVVLDQVHERDIDTDFILTALKRIVRGFPKVRIVLMSATIDNELFRYYFASDHIDKFMKEDNFYQKIIELEEYKKSKSKNLEENNDNIENEILISDDSDQQENRKRQIYDQVALKFLSSNFPCPAININEPSNFKRTYFYLDTMGQFVKREHVKKWGSIHWSYRHPNTHKELFEAATIIIGQIRHNCRNKHDLSGEAVLVFLPGLNEIENFSEDVFTFLGGRETVYSDFELIHVHSTIMTEEIQQKINTPNRKKIKLIISTNIAQSSITVKGVKYIIDFCLTKQIRYNDKSRMENLELVYSSRASCKQRAGRTGRVCDGYIFRMVEKKFYDGEFEDYSEPEIKRLSLDKLILRIKLMHENDKHGLFADPIEVLGTCIQPPKLESIESAIDSLKFCGGLEQNGSEFIITELGKLYVQIPIDIGYAKLLIVSILFGTFNDILILVSMLSQNKSAVHRRDVELNFFKYFDRISNHEYCDFLALVNLFKDEDEARKGGYGGKFDKNNTQKDRIKFAIYTETKNTMDDIMKRLQRKWFNFGELSEYLENREGHNISSLSKKCHFEKHPKLKYTDYYMRWKMTLAFGFVDKLILIKPPAYDNKQEKRIKDMKRAGISNDRTVVLLNSSVINPPRNSNPETIQKTVSHWKNVFQKSINVKLGNLTLTSGLNYLHFDDDLELNKLLFCKDMDSMIRKRATGSIFSREEDGKGREVEEKGCFLSVKQLIECLGDIDHMQTGIPYTLGGRQERVRIDQHSLNRICSYVESAPNQYLLTNSFMLQGKHDLNCRYTSALNIFSFDRSKPPNTILHIISNILFYPFVKLKCNRQQTEYEYLALKRKYMMKIEYQLKEGEIQKANIIRKMIKEFFEFKRKINPQNCEELWKNVKNFVIRKRRSVINEINDELWQEEFMKEVKKGTIKPPPATLIIKEQPNQNTNFNPILQEVNNNQTTKKKPFQQMESTYQTKNFMNSIDMPEIGTSESYFSKPPKETADSYKNRMSFYISWKKGKLNEVMELSKYALDNDSYLCCGGDPMNNVRCDIPLCKLKRVGPMDDQFTRRDLFGPIMQNMKISQETESEIDDFLLNQNYQDEYVKYSCINNHEIGIRNKSQTKIKIFIIKSYTIKYPDIENSRSVEGEFEKLDMQHWTKQESAAIQRKSKWPLKKSCFICAQQICSFQEAKTHMANQYHLEAVEKFEKLIGIGERELLGVEEVEDEIKREQKEDKEEKQKQKQKQTEKEKEKEKERGEEMEIQY